MAVLGKFVQTSTERKRYIIDYTDWLLDGELLSTAVFVTQNPDDLSDPAIVDSSAIDQAGKTIVCYISGGATGAQYKILATITTNMTQTKEDEIIIRVKDY